MKPITEHIPAIADILGTCCKAEWTVNSRGISFYMKNGRRYFSMFPGAILKIIATYCYAEEISWYISIDNEERLYLRIYNTFD